MNKPPKSGDLGFTPPKMESAFEERRRGRPQGKVISPLGQLILRAMQLLSLSYEDIAVESRRLAMANDNDGMAVGRSTLGNIISGRIRQPSAAKLESLRIILHLTQHDIEAALGLQSERRFAEQLKTSVARTHELPRDGVARQRMVRVPLLRRDADLNNSQFLYGVLDQWLVVNNEYLETLYPPYMCYVVVGESDRFVSPIAPPGTRLLVNKLLTKVPHSEHLSFHERELFYVLTPSGFTCCYLECTSSNRIVVIPHPQSGHVREEFNKAQVQIIGQVIGLMFPK